MKKMLLIVCLLAFPHIAFAQCAELMKKYNAPNPASKTMKQITRWISKKVNNPADSQALESCMIALAADNPNKEQVAGK